MIDLNRSRNLAVRRRAGCFHGLFLLPVVITSLGLLLAGQVKGQTFTTLHTFTGGSGGATPYAVLILSGKTLYGTAQEGGNSGNGSVFAINIDGTGFTNLYSFTAGSTPNGLLLSGNTLYGTAQTGGSSDHGTVFKVNTDGTGFKVLHSFTATSGSGGLIGTNSDGCFPGAGLILSGSTLYGTARFGCGSGNGTAFNVNTNGTGFTVLHSFTAGSVDDNGNITNSDGANPLAGLILSGNTLYGTASGGSSGNGTVFAVNTDGTGFTNLHTFTGNYTEGANPNGLLLSGNTLYGTAKIGGSGFNGTVFAIDTDGTGFRTLYSFTESFDGPNSDGAKPGAGLILSGNTLYGTASLGGSSDHGTVFASEPMAVALRPCIVSVATPTEPIRVV
jgi:uncharacterized repeat protein (TIGR03803 family)